MWERSRPTTSLVNEKPFAETSPRAHPPKSSPHPTATNWCSRGSDRKIFRAPPSCYLTKSISRPWPFWYRVPRAETLRAVRRYQAIALIYVSLDIVSESITFMSLYIYDSIIHLLFPSWISRQFSNIYVISFSNREIIISLVANIIKCKVHRFQSLLNSAG